MIQPLQAGQQAPDFNLLDKDEQPHQLSQYQGKKVLVYFYPKAMTPGCTVQAKNLAASLEKLTAKNVVVLGISPDMPSKLQRFADKHQLNFPLLSDPDHQIAEAFGVWGEKKFMGRTFDGLHRKSFLIDEEGVILHYFDKFKTSNHHEVVMEVLDNL